ncbi:Alpha-tocopherol transfer protein-like [Argiope bruennichi]|uniref:Alpha-tocopherol transfer protein-like n=1 Tax=Argiope bruennichi TaxID=94029 RepID=A0A8T0ESS9_ARGBR|nr:Alpha-tocopherol transfer protein-like [Argiope bruennichi]
MNIISNDIEDVDDYPLDIRYIPAPIQEKYHEIFPQDDWKYLALLKEMLQEEEISRGIEFEDDFLRLYLICNNYKIDRAFSMILNCLHLRKNHDYLFRNISFDFTQHPAYKFINVLPQRRKDGSVTVVFKVAKWNPDEVPFEHLKLIMFMIPMQQLRNPVTQASGFNLIYDFADAGIRYMRYGTPQNVYLFHHVSFEVLPMRFLGYHLVNVNFIGNFLVSLIRPFLPKDIEKVFYTHSSLKNYLITSPNQCYL